MYCSLSSKDLAEGSTLHGFHWPIVYFIRYTSIMRSLLQFSTNHTAKSPQYKYELLSMGRLKERWGKPPIHTVSQGSDAVRHTPVGVEVRISFFQQGYQVWPDWAWLAIDDVNVVLFLMLIHCISSDRMLRPCSTRRGFNRKHYLRFRTRSTPRIRLCNEGWEGFGHLDTCAYILMHVPTNRPQREFGKDVSS
jgi:hypothetical protein